MSDIQGQGESYFKSINEFEFDLRILNQGLLGISSVGTIRLALHKGTNKMYAVKIIQLSKFDTQSELKLIKREIAIHSQLDHPHIIKLWSAFFEGSKIYMIMEYAQNNSLFSYIAQHECLGEPQAFKYFYQCVKSVEYLHKCDVIHRDLKTENVLMDQNFNIKLCDFGWSTTDLEMKRSTMCGTYQYVAPEMINGVGYDYRVDVWGLGVLLYEMVHGRTPFEGGSQEETKQKMMYPLKFSNRVSVHLRLLLEKLLAIEPNNRLSIPEILQHQWTRKMKSLINTTLKKDSNFTPTQLSQKITKLVSPTHKKTQSSNLSKKQSNSNININLMINNYSSKKCYQKQPNESLKLKILNGYKTFTDSNDVERHKKYDKANVFENLFKYPQYNKIISKIKSSEDFSLKDGVKKGRRKSQDYVTGSSHVGKTDGVRTVTETSQKKRSSKKKKTYDDLTSLLKKAGSGSNLFCRRHKVI